MLKYLNARTILELQDFDVRTEKVLFAFDINRLK